MVAQAGGGGEKKEELTTKGKWVFARRWTHSKMDWW